MAQNDVTNPFDNNYTSILLVDAVCIATVISCTSLRFYVRKCILGKLHIDDWLLLAGVVCYVISCSFDIAAWTTRARVGVVHGDPGHLYELIDILAFLMGEILVRGAYTTLYLKMVPKDLGLERQRYFLLGVFSVYAMFQLAAALTYLLQCGDPRNVGKPSSRAHCISPAALSNLFNAIFYFDCIFDWLMVFIPMRVIWSISMKRATKIATMLVVSLGCCAGALSIVVIALSHEQQHYSQASGADMHLSIRIDMATTTEIMVAILCLCLATYKPLVRKWIENKTERTRAASSVWTTATNLPSPATLVFPEDRTDSLATKTNHKKIFITSIEIV